VRELEFSKCWLARVMAWEEQPGCNASGPGWRGLAKAGQTYRPMARKGSGESVGWGNWRYASWQAPRTKRRVIDGVWVGMVGGIICLRT